MLLAPCLGAAHGSAAEPAAGLTLRLEPPGVLHVGERRSVDVVVELADDAGLPLLLTPVSEGDAVQVVRGRLLRSDASDPTAARLTLRIPIAVAAEGTAVLRVDALAYACDPRCRPLRASDSAVLTVRAAP